MTELLVNAVEQSQPDDVNGTWLHLFCRSAEEPERRLEVVAKGFQPYFYVLEDEARQTENFLLSQDSISSIDYVEAESFPGHEMLAKVTVPYPQDTRDARELFDETWNADVPFTRRFLIDTDIHAYVEVPDDAFDGDRAEVHWTEIEPAGTQSSGRNPRGSTGEDGAPEVASELQQLEPRVCTLDIEVDDRGDEFPSDGDRRVLSIVAHDNYRDETIGFIDMDGRDINDAFPNGSPDNVDELRCEPTEKRMFINFRSWFNDVDPDLVTGWNVDDFDLPYIIDRMEKVSGVSPNVLSPMGWTGENSRGDPRVKGRTVYDLLTVYKANQFTKIRSYSLDFVAGKELDAEKVEFDGSYFELYENDPEKFIRYNARDVELTAGVDEAAGVIEFRDILRREVGVMFGDSYYNKDFVDMMCRRDLREQGVVGPTRPSYGDEPDSDYEGAYVFDAYEGVAQNVVAIDLASLYPYTMAMLNASPETKGSPTDDNVTVAQNGQAFTQDMDGLFKRLVDDAISLKSDYKAKRAAADTDEEYEHWDNKYGVAKTLTNSIYGVTGWERFFLYDEAVAEAVTLTGQWIIKNTAEFVEEEGFEVIYGDTDSVYVKLPDDWSRDETLESARAMCEELNDDVYPRLMPEIGLDPGDSLMDIEVEAHIERFFQAGKKKRYAYVASWKDGREVEEPEPKITGFSSKRSDSSRLTAKTEKEIFDAILFGNVGDIGEIMAGAAEKIEARSPEWELVGIPGGLNQRITDDFETSQRDNYYAVSCNDDGCYPQDAHPRAVYNSNKILRTRIGKGDKPMRVYIQEKVFDELGRQVDVLAFEEETDLEPVEDEIIVDVQRMTETLLVNPFARICDAVDVDVHAAVRGQTQTGLDSFV